MRDVRKLGDNRLEELDPLRGYLGHRRRKPGDVATRTGQSRDEALANWITTKSHDGDRPRCLLDGSYGRSRRSDDHVDLEVNDLGGEAAKPVRAAIRIAGVDYRVLPLHIAEVA